MKIFTISNVPLAPTQAHGCVITGFVERLRQRGHEVDVCSPENYQLLRGLKFAPRLRLQIGYTAACMKAVRSGKYDLIHAFGGEAWQTISRCQLLRNRPLMLAHANTVEPHATEQLSRDGKKPGTWLSRQVDSFLHYDWAY
ncbi:MAG: hypothetical protein ACQKBW_09450, partial [Puniceicoccales bacterium]